MGSGLRLGDFIERTAAVSDPWALVGELKRALGDFGFQHIACGAIGGHALYQSALPAPAVVVDYPPEWQRHYFEKGYVGIDPVVTRAAYTRVPYHWEQLRDLTPGQARLFNEAREAGLKQGITVPIHGPAGEVFVASVASSFGDVEPRMAVTVVNLLVNQFHSAWMSLVVPGAPEAPVQLTLREQECLVWSARGKSSWDIGVILNISENTVNFHLKNALAKLGASTRIMAIVKAIRMGVIVP